MKIGYKLEQQVIVEYVWHHKNEKGENIVDLDPIWNIEGTGIVIKIDHDMVTVEIERINDNKTYFEQFRFNDGNWIGNSNIFWRRIKPALMSSDEESTL